jgi:hypothetical protein
MRALRIIIWKDADGTRNHGLTPETKREASECSTLRKDQTFQKLLDWAKVAEDELTVGNHG